MVKMKKLVQGIGVVLALGTVVANAAVVVSLNGGNDDQQVVFTYSDLGASTLFTCADLRRGTEVAENTISGASGSFSVSWTATEFSENFDAATWSIGSATAVIDMLAKGWGVRSAGQEGGAAQLSAGEAFVLRFDLKNLTLAPKNRLVFSVLAADGESYRIYERTGERSGVVASSVSKSDSGYASAVAVSDLTEYAITDPGHAGGLELRIRGFSVDVLPEGATPKFELPKNREKKKPAPPVETIGLRTASIDVPPVFSFTRFVGFMVSDHYC